MTVLQVNDQNFDSEVLKSELPVLVDFFAVWCGPCQMAGPIIDEVAEDMAGKLKVVKLNVDEASETAGKFGVMSIPTVIVFKGGVEAKRLVGFAGKEGYLNLLKEAGVE